MVGALSSFLTPSTGFWTGSLSSGEDDEGSWLQGTWLNGMTGRRISSGISTGLIGGEMLCGLVSGDPGGDIDGLLGSDGYAGEYLTGL